MDEMIKGERKKEKAEIIKKPCEENAQLMFFLQNLMKFMLNQYEQSAFHWPLRKPQSTRIINLFIINKYRKLLIESFHLNIKRRSIIIAT